MSTKLSEVESMPRFNMFDTVQLDVFKFTVNDLESLHLRSNSVLCGYVNVQILRTKLALHVQ